MNILQIGNGVSLYHAHRQWVDLGVLEEACITHPETCGAAGGAAVALWVKPAQTSEINIGVVSSEVSNRSTGFSILRYNADLE